MLSIADAEILTEGSATGICIQIGWSKLRSQRHGVSLTESPDHVFIISHCIINIRYVSSRHMNMLLD